MTREEKIEAFTMRLDGCTYDHIANVLGCTKQDVQDVLTRVCKVYNKRNARYPGLMHRLKVDYGSYATFTEKYDISITALKTLFDDRKEESPKAISAVCRAYPDIPYAELFK